MTAMLVFFIHHIVLQSCTSLWVESFSTKRDNEKKIEPDMGINIKGRKAACAQKELPINYSKRETMLPSLTEIPVNTGVDVKFSSAKINLLKFNN